MPCPSLGAGQGTHLEGTTMTCGEVKKRLLAARWCLNREFRRGPFGTYTFLRDDRALLSGDGKWLLVLGLFPDNPNGVGLKRAP
jgi:hypothetical protein